MSLIQLHLEQPDLFKSGTVADVADAVTKTADYESSAPTGMPSFTDIEAWESQLIGLYTNTGQIVTPERAKRCATVLAIMRALSEDVGGLPMPLYKRGGDEDVIADKHPVQQILNVAPNDVMTPLDVREHTMFDAMLYGGWFHLKNLDPTLTPFDTGFGEIDSIWPLSAAYVVRRYRELVWTFTDPTTGMSGQFTPDLVWRGSIMSTNGIDGVGITTLAKEAIGTLLAAEEQGARLFNHGIQTDFVLESDNEVGDEERKDIRTALMRRHAGSRNSFMPMILEGGLKASKLGLTAQESQYLESRNFQTAEICHVFRYPDVMMGGSGTKGAKGATFASAEQFFESYTKHTLGPWTTRFEQTGARDFLAKKERPKYFFRTDFSGMTKGNETARIANWNAKIQGGWAQPAEARRAEGMKFMPTLNYFSKPAGSTGVAGDKPGPQQADPTPTDQSALAGRVAAHLFSREEKAIIGSKQDADFFYTNFGAYIESMTGADMVAVRGYLELRRNTPHVERFGLDAMRVALAALTSLCKG